MSFGARARMRPVLYPAAILVAFVLGFLVSSGVSPLATGRPLIVAVGFGLLAPWVAGLATANRDRAGVLSLLLVLIALTAATPALLIPSLVAFALVALQPLLGRRAAPSAAGARDPLRLATRVLTIGSAILLVAVGINAVQLGRVQTFAQDLAAEPPLRGRPVAAGPAPPGAPNMVFVLLDGYPRADKLLSEFGIDNSAFIRDLRARDFAVSGHSRSNETVTELTLAQMFNYEAAGDIARRLDGPTPLWRVEINDGSFFRDLHGLGYETVAIPPGIENVALRRADVFVDTGQLNEFEWALVGTTGLSVVADALMPNLAADADRSRILDAFKVAEEEAQSLGAVPKFVLVHVLAPHSPQVFDALGQPLQVPGIALPYEETSEISRFGFGGYTRRLDGELQFLDKETIQLVDAVTRSDPGAVIVVFSDHGSGAPSRSPGAAPPYADLRTANLLAVRSPGRTGIIDDRSTLANLLPRLLRAYTGTGPADVPETIYAWTGDPARSFFFDRPD